jgi:hypothetical protein
MKLMIPKKAKQENETLSTSFNLGFVYANKEEGEREGKIEEAGFTKEERVNRETGKTADLPICIVKVKFIDEQGNTTFLEYKTIVSRAENSRFISLLKEFNVPFGNGNVDVANIVGAKVIASIKNNEDENGRSFSNIEFIKRAES